MIAHRRERHFFGRRAGVLAADDYIQTPINGEFVRFAVVRDLLDNKPTIYLIKNAY